MGLTTRNDTTDREVSSPIWKATTGWMTDDEVSSFWRKFIGGRG